MLWLIVIAELAASVGAQRAWPTDGQRIAMTLALCIAALGVCWFLFELLLYARFPTKKLHTVAARNTAIALCVVLVGQAVLAIARL